MGLKSVDNSGISLFENNAALPRKLKGGFPMKKVLSLVLALALVLGCASFATAENAKIKLVVWGNN